ncbi:MAG: non-canonical purine NTP pyrophosphatase [Gemmatimonadaceae bacterium]
MTDAPLVLATRSEGKVRELAAMCAGHGFAAIDLSAAGLPSEDPAEDTLEVHDTFEANARAKAAWFSARLPGRIVVADDSGLEVLALGGAPGVRSKRWTGSTATGTALYAENNAALLAALEGFADRRARFVCVMVARCGDQEWIGRGSCAGRILEAPVGGEGFGYDPLFWSEELGAAFGAVGREVKGQVSHRARAFAALLAALEASPPRP